MRPFELHFGHVPPPSNKKKRRRRRDKKPEKKMIMQRRHPGAEVRIPISSIYRH